MGRLHSISRQKGVCLDLVQFLLKHDPSAAAQDQDRLTSIHLASEWGHLKLAWFLVEHGTNVAAQDQEGSTPFHLASELGYLELAQFLVEHNTNTAAQNQGEVNSAP